MMLLTISEALWFYFVLVALCLNFFIGAWIGYRRRETFYRHCNKEDEDDFQMACYVATAFLWPLRFPYDRARTKK